MKFRAILELHGKTATGIEVPPEVVESFGRGKRVPVEATINGFTYRTTVAPMSGCYFIPVAAAIREGAGVQALEEVEVELKVDDKPREVEVPEDLAAALEGDPVAKAKFDRLSYSNRKEHALALTSAKTPETRLRRLAKIIDSLQ